jgi:hypothetical protein
MAGSAPGRPDDFLYIIVRNRFYRLSPVQVRGKAGAHEIPKQGGDAEDREVVETLTKFQEHGVMIANLSAGGAGVAASCACLALNIDLCEGAAVHETKKLLQRFDREVQKAEEAEAAATAQNR